MAPASRIRDIGIRDGRFIRALRLDKAGDCHPGEQHYFDHDSVVTLGTIQVRWRDPDGATGESVHTAETNSSTVCILARRWHEITAVGGPAEWECRFDVRDTDGELVLDIQDADPTEHYSAGVPQS